MKPRYRVIGIVICVGAIVAIQAWRRSAPMEPPAPPAFSGDSSGLKATVIVPTLDTPMPPGKNVIWCSSFQIAWNKLKDDIIKAPVQVKGAEDVAKRLNSAPQSEKDLPPESYYAAAGYVEDGICEQIRSAMAQKFPNVPAPTFNVPQDGLVAYAYLAASVKFTTPYNDSKHDLKFNDSAGTATAVASFGFGFEHGERNEEDLSRQVAVLWPKSGRDAMGEIGEFAVDMCRDSQPNQLVLARVSPQATLADTYKDVQSKIDAPGGDRQPGVTLLWIPKTAWKVIHHFKELEGEDKLLLNAGFEQYFIFLAQQDIDFKLDQSGAALVSEARLEEAKAGMAAQLVCDRPFLIVMRKRGATEPFFVMWVDNAELLTKR